jgi:hypothetical protein
LHGTSVKKRLTFESAVSDFSGHFLANGERPEPISAPMKAVAPKGIAVMNKNQI